MHKEDPQNVLLSRVQPTSLPDVYIGQFRSDPSHKFWFEHEVNHFPGLMLFEAVIQFGMAISEIYYKTDYRKVFILQESNITFSKFAEMSLPCFIVSHFDVKKMENKNLTNDKVINYIIQNREVIGKVIIESTTFDYELFSRLRERQIRQLNLKN